MQTHRASSPLRLTPSLLGLGLALALFGCGDDGVGSDQEARLAYLGLDDAIEKSLSLGFAGFNAASSANIPLQSTEGELSGTLTITGQVDQGASANKGMRLKMGLVDYSDGELQAEDGSTDGLEPDERDVELTYATAATPDSQPALDLSLRNIPNGTFTGTLAGSFQMTGDLEGSVTLDLSFAGEIEDDGTGKVRRKAGTTQVTGTATTGDDTYDVDVTR